MERVKTDMHCTLCARPTDVGDLDSDGICSECTPAQSQISALRAQLAAARADAVRGFAKDLDDSSGLLNRGYYKEYAARYLSSLGVPSARPDDAGIVCDWRCECGALHIKAHVGMVCPQCRAVLAAADGEVKP